MDLRHCDADHRRSGNRQATIATGLAAIPIPTDTSELPNLRLVPGLLVGSLSIAIIALAQVPEAVIGGPLLVIGAEAHGAARPLRRTI